MKQFDELMEVAATLNGPGGCPWDHKQTFQSLQPYVIEEAHEVIEAVDANDNEKIIEELGDLLYTVVFYAKIAEKEGRFHISDILERIREKLIRRHPHVFGQQKVEHAEEVAKQWEKIKKTEKGHSERTSALDGIPKTLPSLVKAQKVIKKILRSDSPLFSEREKHQHPCSEAEVGEALFHWILRAEESGLDAESALRRTVDAYCQAFRSSENQK